jgi:hypothetical protein
MHVGSSAEAGEQYPLGPQSESTRQPEEKHWLPWPYPQAHVDPVGQSASLVHLS